VSESETLTGVAHQDFCGMTVQYVFSHEYLIFYYI